MVSIPYGVATEDNNFTKFLFGDLGALVLVNEQMSEILEVVSGVTRPCDPISMQVRLQLYPFCEMSATRLAYFWCFRS